MLLNELNLNSCLELQGSFASRLQPRFILIIAFLPSLTEAVRPYIQRKCLCTEANSINSNLNIDLDTLRYKHIACPHVTSFKIIYTVLVAEMLTNDNYGVKKKNNTQLICSS